MGINFQTTAVAYNPETNEVRIVMLIEADSREEAVREAQRQLAWLKRDAGEQAPEVSDVASEWPEWADSMMMPLLYSKEHGEFPPGYRRAHSPPPDLAGALEAMSYAAGGTADAEREWNDGRVSILLRPAPSGLYEALGQIAAHGAGIEQALGDLRAQLGRVVGTTPPGTDALAYYRGRLHDLVRAASASVAAAAGYIGADVLSATRAFLARVEAALDTRNTLIHSQWWSYTDPDGMEGVICRWIPQSSQESAAIEWRINQIQDLLDTGQYFMELDREARFLVARIMTLADRIQGVEDSSGPVEASIDLTGLSEEERAAIVRRLDAGHPPPGLEFLGPLTDVRYDPDTDSDRADQPSSDEPPQGMQAN